jgi:mRNA interferase YafQ
VLQLKYTAKMKRDVKRLRKRGNDMMKLDMALRLLVAGQQIPKSYHDHLLKGEYRDFHECHIESDWLLIYRIFEDELVLLASGTGTHADLFDE